MKLKELTKKLGNMKPSRKPYNKIWQPESTDTANKAAKNTTTGFAIKYAANNPTSRDQANTVKL